MGGPGDRLGSQIRYEQMLANSATAAICAGGDGRIISWNSAAEALFGYSANEVTGKPLSVIIPERHRASHNAGLARSVKSGRARLAGQAVEILALHAEGHELPVDLSLSMWFEGEAPMFGALIRDVTDRSRAQKRLEHLAHCDTLTSLPNRNALRTRLTDAVEAATCSLLLLDLSDFKHVNDSLGHTVGDQLLVAFATRLVATVGNAGYVARLGGDEFAVLIDGCGDPLVLDRLANDITASLESAFPLLGEAVFVDTSMGIAIAPNDGATAEQLLSSAGLALHEAKSEGGNTRIFFNQAMQRRAENKLRLGRELRKAHAEKQFELWYQPQVCLRSGKIIGAEALLRWRHLEHGILSPDKFISVLESSAIAESVGDWIVNEACAAAARWAEQGLGNIRIGINLFGAQLRSNRIFGVFSSAIDRHGIRPDQIEIEITENTVLRHMNHSMEAVQRLKEIGVGVAFDDFGTGFASLSLLQKYPLTRLKIDRGFITDLERAFGDAAIVGGVINIAKSLGLSVIAEGIECAGQERILTALGCDEGQGYKYGKPMPEHDLLSVLVESAMAKACA